MIKTHIITKQRLLLKKNRGLISVLFLLDEQDNKIQKGLNTNLEPYYKIVICLNKNLI
jgi:hypothetical protein